MAATPSHEPYPVSALVEPLAPHRLDASRLARYLAPFIPGLGTIALRQYQGGQSNPTYFIGSSIGNFVLRKKPPGVLLASAHMIEREYRILRALEGSGVPVPRALHLCEDAGVIGTPFFVMAHVEGRVFDSPALPEAPRDERAAIFRALPRILAKLHAVDWRAAGLEGFGRPENYIGRQLERWTRQYRESIGEAGLPDMETLIAWLSANTPEEGPAAIAHGDFRLGNMIYHPARGEIVAVLDWELSTLGDPLSDLAYCALCYHLPHGVEGVKGLAGLDIAAAGIPPEARLVAEYAAARGLSAIPHWNFYLGFSLFRLVAILQGVYARAVQGNASSSNALVAGRNAGLLARIGREIVEGGGR